MIELLVRIVTSIAAWCLWAWWCRSVGFSPFEAITGGVAVGLLAVSAGINNRPRR